jgi:phage major head subunit gpT-like protein
MSGVITTGSFPKALKPGVNSFFGLTYDEKEQQCKYLFDTEQSVYAYEEDVATSGTGLAPVKGEGESVQYDSAEQFYTNKATNIVYGLGFQITREEMEDNKYDADLLRPLVNKKAGQLAFSMRETKENIAAGLYNRAVTAGYTFGDGKTMLATDHPTKVGTQSNTAAVAIDLSEAAVEAGLIQIMNYKDNTGKRISVKGEKLIVPTALTFEAERILKSSMQITTSTFGTDGITNTNAINAIQSALAPYTNNYLTDSDAWFIRTNCRGMVHYERRAVDFTEDNDFDTENAKFKATERYSFTMTDHRAIYGSEGAA